ncbi:MAG: hypothetical protein AAF727_15510 [Pseudomonadota bacterium]
MLRISVLVLPLALAACSDTLSTRDTTFMYQGEVLRAEIRTYDQNGRVFDRRVIEDGIRSVSCSATDDRDCDAALRERRSNRDRF